MQLTNLKVYDLDQSILASGFPMSINQIDTEILPKTSDFERTYKLANSKIGSGHNCFLKGIRISLNVQASQNWWIQMMRYNYVDIVSSQSKMHRIVQSISVNNEHCFDKHVDQKMINRILEMIDEYITCTKTIERDEMFLNILYSCPFGYMLNARISTNYLQLKTIYNQRRTHRLPEWIQFCQYIEMLPMAAEFITQGR